VNTGEIDDYAVAGAAGVVAIANGEEHFIAAERVRTIKGVTVAGTQRHHNQYRLPDDPRLAPHLRGAELILRLPTNQQDRDRGLNRAEVLRQIPEGDPDWDTV
jgi:hypothetical protein